MPFLTAWHCFYWQAKTGVIPGEKIRREICERILNTAQFAWNKKTGCVIISFPASIRKEIMI